MEKSLYQLLQAQDRLPMHMPGHKRAALLAPYLQGLGAALPLLRPAIVTVLLLSVVGTWNNFFLPLAVLSDPNLLPVTVGLNNWQALSNAGAGGEQVWNLIVTGAFVSVLPLIISFLALQKYWQGGLSLGALK